MKASNKTIRKNDKLVFLVDEYHQGNKSAEYGTVTSVNKDGVNMIYLSGHRSRDDLVPWADVIAKEDLSAPRIDLGEHNYRGHFVVFDRDA